MKSESNVHLETRTTFSCSLPTDLTVWLSPNALLTLAFEAAQHPFWHSGDQPFPTHHQPVFRTLLLFAYATGIYDSHEISTALRQHPTLRYICAGLCPTGFQLRTFRRAQRRPLQYSLAALLEAAWRRQCLRQQPASLTDSADALLCFYPPDFQAHAQERLDRAVLADAIDADE